MPAETPDLRSEGLVTLDYERLRVALRDASAGHVHPSVAEVVLSEISAHRERIASPLSVELIKRPNAEDRAKIAGHTRVTLFVPSAVKSITPHPVQLHAEQLEAALHLSNKLDINEIDAALLFLDARAAAVHRPDLDVISAATQLFHVRRCESIHYLQELLRAPLIPTTTEQSQQFISLLVQERDLLIKDHNVVTKVINRIQSGLKLMQEPNGNRRDALLDGEVVLLAECLFLMAYTVQLSASEACAIRALLEAIGTYHKKIVDEEAERKKSNQLQVAQFGMQNSSNPLANGNPEVQTEARVDLDSTLNLVVLSWMCALDRSRYQDVYDPRTGGSNINLLLRDEAFYRETTKLPPMTDALNLMVSKLDKSVLAAEFIGAIFRLAVAAPDEDEASQTALRVCAYGGCLSYLANDLPAWIESGAGSLTPDADLYADALEDLAIDTAEAPRLSSEFVYWHASEISRIAANLAQDSYIESTMADDRSFGAASPAASGRVGTLGSPRVRFERNGASPFTPKTPLNTSTPTGKPPLPPSNRPPSLPRFGNALDTPRNGVFGLGAVKQESAQGGHNGVDNGDIDPNSKFCINNNVVALLARFVGRAMKLAPGKLEMGSVFKGPRYWVGMEGPGTGFIMRISEAVWDLFEAAERNIYTGNGVGNAFTEALDGFLFLLAASVGSNNSVHAAQALRFLLNAGDALVSMNKLKGALDHFINLIKQPLAPRAGNHPTAYNPIEDAEANLITGIVNVIIASAKGLQDQGGLDAFLGGLGTDLAMKFADLAIYNVNSNLRASLINGLIALQDCRAISFFLSNTSKNNAAMLQHLTSSIEGENGRYDVTVSVLELVAACTKWPEEDYPYSAIEAIAIHFAIEEVIHKWSRRNYASEVERWRTIKAAASFLLAVGYREARTPHRGRMLKIMARLLMPAPGTGAASQALRSLFAATGLRRNSDSAFRALNSSALPNDNGGYYNARGRDLLLQTANAGLGEAYKAMEQVVIICSKVMLGLFEISPGEVSSIGQVSANLGDLIVIETASIVSASSMVFSVDCSNPKTYKAGYSEEACSSVLMMLATASHSSSKVAALLASGAASSNSLSSSFRASLADIIAQGEATLQEFTSEQQIEGKGDSQPLLYSALRIVEACLGEDGGGQPGLYLLGLKFDTSGRLVSADYGVLKALLELMNGFGSGIDQLDGKARSTAAVFVQRLAATTVRKTSQAVNEYLKQEGEADVSVRGGGLSDELLFRILDFCGTQGGPDARDPQTIDWSNVAELASACMALSALQVHIFPESEMMRSSRAEDQSAISSSPKALNGAPSPYELFRLIVFVSSYAPRDVVFEAFKNWYSLLGIRAMLDAKSRSPAAIPIFLELTQTLLNALASADTSNEMALMVRKDGGYIACSSVLTCVRYVCEWINPQSKDQKLIGEAQVTDLLAGIIGAASGLVGSSLDTSRARTMLYASFLQVVPVAKQIASDEGVARAFGGRVGARQVSGTEGLIASCCVDAAGCPSPATKAVALATACMITLTDPMRAVPALGSQNRLRRIVSTSIADQEARALIARACNRTGLESNVQDPQMARERAAKVVGEAALSLVHAVSTAPNGHRTLIDSGCVDAVAALLSSLNSSRLSNLMVENHGSQHARVGLSDIGVNNISSAMDTQLEPSNLYDAMGPSEKRASLIALICSAVAAAMTSSDSVLLQGSFDLIAAGHGCFMDILRMFRSGLSAYLEAISALALIWSRIPPKLVATIGSDARTLRYSIAGALSVFVSPGLDVEKVGETAISRLGTGFADRLPSNQKEVRRSKTWHPYGGSIYDRDIACARISCLYNLMTALRPRYGSTLLFKPTLGNSNRGEGVRVENRDSNEQGPICELTDVYHVTRAALEDVRRFSEESVQAKSFSSTDSVSTVTAQKKEELIAFCVEKREIGDGERSAAIVAECMMQESEELRHLANRCISIFESGLFILREYLRNARGGVRGDPDYDSANKGLGSEVDGISKSSTMSAVEGRILLEQAKRLLLPLCKEIDAQGTALWGSKDPSFCKQLSRQMRAYIVK